MEGEELLVCAATDAMRVALGLPTRNFSREQIVDFLSRPIREAQAGEIEELRSRIRELELEAEVARLRHDLERHIEIAATEATRAEAAEARLREVELLALKCRYGLRTVNCNGLPEAVRPSLLEVADELDAILKRWARSIAELPRYQAIVLTAVKRLVAMEIVRADELDAILKAREGE